MIMNNNDILIKTDRLFMKRLEVSEAPIVFIYRSDKAVSVYQSFHPQTIADVIQFIQNNTISIDVDNTWYQLGIHLHNGELIGDFGIHFINREKGKCEIGYTIRPEYQRKGYGKESVYGVIQYLYETMNKNEVIASVDPRNEASKRMLESIGFLRKEQQNNDDIEYVMFRKTGD